MISLKRQYINTTIAERYATIIYSFDFENTRNGNNSDELRFAITIDPSSFISGFTADIDGELFYGETKEKEEAKQEYTKAKEKNENAILIFQPNKEINNVFQIQTNMDAQSKISLNITIEQYLQKQFDYNTLNIQLLNDFNGTTIRKNYSDIEYQFIVKDKRGIYDLQIPLCDDIKTDDTNKFIYNINGKITSNQLSLTNELVIKYKAGGESDESSLLFDNKSNTFCHIISDITTAAQEQNSDNNLIPRRVVFVIDKSGSMRGNKWNYTVKATIIALRKLRNGIDRYRIILCGSQLDFVPANMNNLELVQEESINNSITYLETQIATGAEQLNEGLLEGIKAIKYDIIKLNSDKDFEYNFFMNQIIFISDGRPTIGECNVKKIITNVKNANDISKIDKYSKKISLFSFGVGRDGNGCQWMNDLPHQFLKSLSVNNNGFYKRIKQKTADKELTEYIDILSKPISCNITIKYEKMLNNLTKTKFNSLYQGNDLIICGQIPSNKKTKNITAVISSISCKQIKSKNDKLIFKPITVNKTIKIDMENEYDNTNNNNNNNIERVWAYLSLQQYATKKLKYNDMIEMDDDEQKEEDKIPLQLAIRYKFVTPWTSMIVVKSKDKQMNNIDNIEPVKQDDIKQNDTMSSGGTYVHLLKNIPARINSKPKTMAYRAPPRKLPPMKTGSKATHRILTEVHFNVSAPSGSSNMPTYHHSSYKYKTSSSVVLTRILKELKDLENSYAYNFSAGPISDDATKWNATIIGPNYSPYDGYMFLLEIVFPSDYPMQPPKCKFLTKIYHCNIGKNGEIGLDLLKDKWSPVVTIKKLLLEIIKLLGKPDVENALMDEIAKMCKENRKQYDKIAREWSQKYGKMYHCGGMPDI